MTRFRHSCGPVVVALMMGLASLVAGACGAAPLDGSLSIVGSSNLLPMMSTLGGSFAAQNPLVRLDLRMKGTGDGLGLFCDGLASISGASRRMSVRERAACSAAGVRFVRLKIADDAVVLFTGRQMRVACLTDRQVYGLMGPQSIDVATWSGASAVLPGSGDDLPDIPLTIVGPGAGSGTKRVLVDLLISPIAEQQRVPAELRSDYTVMASEQLVPDAVAPTDGALGFSGLAAFTPQRSRLQALDIDVGGGCVAPSLAEIRSGGYPLGRPLYLYVNLGVARSDAVLRDFVDHVLTADGLAAAARSGSIALDAATGDRVRAHWKAALSGGEEDAG